MDEIMHDVEVARPMPPVMEALPTRPWGFWATTGFSAIVVAVYFGISAVAAISFIVAAKVSDPQADIEQIGETVSQSGLLMAVCSILVTLPVVGLCLLFAKCRRGMAVREYLAFRGASGRQWLLWLGVYLVFLLLCDGLTLLLGRPVVPESMVTFYRTSVFPPLLLFAIVLCAPLSEELFFRGFMLKGLKACPLGAVGAVILTSLLWAVPHLQYDWYGISTIFVGGLILGTARIRTGSLWVPMALHLLQNTVASIQLLISQGF